MTTLDPGNTQDTAASPTPTVSPAAFVLDLRSHRRLRGAYTAGGQLLRRIVPELSALDPALVRPSATAVVAITPDLEGQAPVRPRTLTDLADDSERTRFYPVTRTHDLAFMVSELVGAWATRCRPQGVLLRFWELDAADPTDLELFAMISRRNGPHGVEVLDAGTVPILVNRRRGEDPAQCYIDADGTSEDPQLVAAYKQLDAVDRAARHSARAQELVERAEPGHGHGAIPYHLEHGEDPQEAVPWLMAAQNHSFREAFYDAALDFARRGRRLVSWDQNAKAHNFMTKRMIGSLTYLGHSDEAMEVIHEHRRTTIESAAQMNDAYMMAMTFTRHIDRSRIDQDKALSWINTAIALADGEPDPAERVFYRAFMRNARALVVLHRGDLVQALDLVNESIEIAEDLGAAHELHRSVLLTNRARVLMALGRYDEAMVAFAEVLRLDPDFDDTYFDRAVGRKAMGDLEGALSDLDRAIALNVAFTDAYYNRADILMDLGLDERALADLATLLDIDPDFSNGRINRAMLLISHGELDAAEADLQHGLAIDRGNAELWSVLGLLRTEQGREAEALDSFTEALDRDPSLVEAWCNRAVLHFSAGRLAEAVSDLDRAIELADSPALRVNRGIGRQELGDARGAVRDFDAALEAEVLDPGAVDVAEVLFRRGLSRHELGEEQRAASDWREHLREVETQGIASEHRDVIEKLTVGALGRKESALTGGAEGWR